MRCLDVYPKEATGKSRAPPYKNIGRSSADSASQNPLKGRLAVGNILHGTKAADVIM